MKRRAIFYVDGFNLYYGLRDSCLYTYLWLDIVGLCKKLTKRKTEELRLVKYFTTVSRKPKDKRERHLIYLTALGTTKPLIEIYHGKYYRTSVKCWKCGREYQIMREKRTDVNLGCQLVRDVCEDEFDVAYLITGDSDLVPAIEIAKQINPIKKIGLWFPPGRTASDLNRIADFKNIIFQNLIIDSQFPDPILLEDGETLSKPDKWKFPNSCKTDIK